MTKAGSLKNLKFLRSGLTIQAHVALAGEVIPLPPTSDFIPRSREEQLRSYGKVHYELSNDPVNVGPTATAKFVRVPEAVEFGSLTTPAETNVPKVSTTERGGGGGQVQLPQEALPSPDADTVPGYESRKVLRQFQDEREQEIAKGDLAAPAKTKKAAAHKDGVIVLRRRPLKKKSMVKATPTAMRRAKVG